MCEEVQKGLSLSRYSVGFPSKKKSQPTRMGFEPTRAEHNGLAVHRLNHSATLSLHRCVLFQTVLSTVVIFTVSLEHVKEYKRDSLC